MKKVKVFAVALVATLGLATSGMVSASNSVAISTVASQSDDWDDVLDSYEAYVDKLIAAAKKVKNGDPTAMTKYAAILKDAQKVQSKLEKVKGNMNSAQYARYQKIALKMANAAASM